MSHTRKPVSATFTAPSPRSLRASLESPLDAVAPDLEPAVEPVAPTIQSALDTITPAVEPFLPAASFGLRGRKRHRVERSRAEGDQRCTGDDRALQHVGISSREVEPPVSWITTGEGPCGTRRAQQIEGAAGRTGTPSSR
jgi:hypothetical protein